MYSGVYVCVCVCTHAGFFCFSLPSQFTSLNPWHMKASWWVVHGIWPMQQNICALSPCTYEEVTPCIFLLETFSLLENSEEEVFITWLQLTAIPYTPLDTSAKGNHRSLKVTHDVQSRLQVYWNQAFSLGMPVELPINARRRASCGPFKSVPPLFESFLMFLGQNMLILLLIFQRHFKHPQQQHVWWII